jgi:PAP2 superfamily
MTKMIETVAQNNLVDGGRGQPSQFLRKRYLGGWLIVALFLMADFAWLYFGGYSVKADDIVRGAKAIGILSCIAVGLGGMAKIPRYKLATKRLRYAEIAWALAWLSLLLFFIPVAGVLSYLSVTVNAPLVDDSLVHFDRALGFDWLSVYHWVHSHGAVQRVLAFAYGSGIWQLIGIPAVLGLLGRCEDLSDFVLHLMLSSILLLLVSTPFPAASAFVHFNIADPNTAATVSDFNLLRNGTMRQFDLTRIQGLVSLPSFHTALAVFFAYSLRRNSIIFPFALLLNVTMIISTPTQGGHYLADVFGGLILALVTIQTLKFALGRRAMIRTPFPANAAPG